MRRSLPGHRILKFGNLIALLVASWRWSTIPDVASLGATITLLVGIVAQEIAAERRENGKEPDKELFKAFLNDLPYESQIRLLQECDMRGKFSSNDFNHIDFFHLEWHDAEHEFHDKKLEKKKRLKLIELTREFTRVASPNFFPIRGVVGLIEIPDEWSYEQPERYKKAYTELNDVTDRIANAHQEFVRLARKRLKV